MNIQKCAIVGCGAVGATAAYTLLGSGLFNERVLNEIKQTPWKFMRVPMRIWRMRIW